MDLAWGEYHCFVRLLERAVSHHLFVHLLKLVDCHVHLNEPGRTDWEGFATGTAASISQLPSYMLALTTCLISQAAASGGVTTLIDMPLNAIPPTTTVSNLHEKIVASEGQCRVDVGFWGGVIPGNTVRFSSPS